MTSILFMLLGADFLLAVLVLLGAQAIIVAFVTSLDSLPFISPSHLAIFGIVLIFAKYFARLYKYRDNDIVGFKEAFLRLLAVLLCSFFILYMLYSISPQETHFPLIIGVALGTFCLIQLFLYYRFPLLYNISGFCHNSLILGAGPYAEEAASIMANRDNLYNFRGFLNQENGKWSISNGGTIDADDLLYKLAEEHKIDRIVVMLDERRENLLVRDLFSCKLRGIKVLDGVNFYERVARKLPLEHINSGWFVFSEGFLVNRSMFIKMRITDIFASISGIVLALPLVPLIALAIKLDSKGPIFYRQARVGLKEKSFQVIKFRTMRSDAEQETGAMWAQKDDDRITRVGRFLRKSRLDEIPQLFNVLKGDMSFIGPRPERPEFVEQLNKTIPFYSRRHSVRPGITGWAQVMYPYGASAEDALEKLRYDLYFIKNFSLSLLLLIIIKTIRVVLFGKGGR